MKKLYFIISIICLSLPIQAQPENDECRFATFIDNVDQYCSEVGAFTNVGANTDPEFTNTCFTNYENGVWFSFIPREPAVLIKVLAGGTMSGTMTNPQITVFSNCGEYLQCSPGRDQSSDEFTLDGLVIGQIHYIMVSSRVGEEGTFTLCINDFLAPRPPESDCGRAVVLCDTAPFSIENLNSGGVDLDEVNGTCIQEEFASSWYTWTCDEPGILTMELIPNNNELSQITDDLDWAIYELPNGVDDCTGKQLLRCMASGENVGQPFPSWAACNGPTGMLEGDNDISEDPGCQSGNNNYTAPINMEAGKSYGLVVNNFSRSGLGFSLEWGGTGTFLGPEPDFDLSAVQAFECDKSVIFTNESLSETDSIVRWEWNFGVGADIPFAEGSGPHDIVYESFGDKIAALTVETSRGCRVTKVLEFFVEACCADTSNLDLDTEVINVNCGGDASGIVTGMGRRGAPQYTFSLDGENFQPNPRFKNLEAGEYEIFVQDQKGCINQTTFVVDEPEPLLVNAGKDTTINLGEFIQLDADHTPPNSNVSYRWIITDSLSCTTCDDPISQTPGTTAYIVEIEDQSGCIARDTIIIQVNKIRDVYAPNIFSPDDNGINDHFGLFGGPSVSTNGVLTLQVFDRWGNMVYQGNNLPLNDRGIGWDGFYNGKALDPGVFTWIAEVMFIDGAVITYTGDITLIR